MSHAGADKLNHIAGCALCRERIKLRLAGFRADAAIAKADAEFPELTERAKRARWKKEQEENAAARKAAGVD
jgi:hypothetical protein